MFIYNQDTQLNLIDYGIEIPLLGKRGLLVLDFIKAHFPKDNLILDPLQNPSRDVLEFAHSKEYIDRLFKNPVPELMETFELVALDGTYHRYQPSLATKPIDDLLRRILNQVSGTILTCEYALKNKFAFHLGGGLHHAMKNGGRGFCLINDIVIAARLMQKRYGLKQIWVIDVDAHKGDGTAALTVHDSSITTMSIHMKYGWPMDMGNGSEDWFIPSDIEIPVEQNDDYLACLQHGLDQFKNYPKPDLCIIVQGSDPYQWDELPSTSLLQLTSEQMLSRDLMVYDFLKQKNIPQAYVMAGGYGERAHEPYINFLEQLLLTRL